MRGVDVSPWTAPLDALFLGGGWVKFVVGDGGNEIGMGKLPAWPDRPHGAEREQITRVTSCDHLVVAVSRTGGLRGSMTALAVARAD